ncbi:MAG: ribonuclease Z [Gemmatimonadota bacterium]
MLRVTFLGTSSSRPTVNRNVPALALKREGDVILFDCGEGTQRQMMRFGVGFGLQHIFITHLHADHYLGLTGLLRTMSLQGREEPVVIWGPPGAHETLRSAVELGGDRLLFAVSIREIPPGESVTFDGYRIEAYRADHRGAANGYVLRESLRLGRFDVRRARELGVPEGPLFGRLHRGEAVELPGGRRVDPSDVVGPPRSGRVVAYSGDTRPGPETVGVAREADLLIHEATFSEDERRRAVETGHSTAREAAQIAAEAGARRLVLTHLSARYSEQPHRLLKEAKEIFPETIVAADGTVVVVAFRDQS